MISQERFELIFGIALVAAVWLFGFLVGFGLGYLV